MIDFQYIDYGKEHFAVSMIKWGWMRRLLVSLYLKIFKPNKFKFPSFVPAFEIAVFYRAIIGKPIVLLHFADEETADHAWYSITSAMKNQGLEGATDYVTNIQFSLKKEFGRIDPDAMMTAVEKMLK